jgi:hypothetical protein
MKCVVCKKGPLDGVSVFRINAKSVPGLWACKNHLRQTDAPKPDPEVVEIVELLERTQP